MTLRVQTLLPVFFLAFLLGADDRGCNCRGTPDEEPVADVDDDPPDVEVALQITSIDPASRGAGERFSARVYGAGFEEGIQVTFSDQPASDTRFQDANTLRVTVGGLDEGVYDVVVTNPDGSSATLRRGLEIVQTIPDCSHLRVHFDFDRANLTSESQEAIDELMPCYTALGDPIRIEGHTDERGPVEYNVGLGQRRADSVARYLSAQGISSARLETVSFGEERPLVRESNEEAWAQNRRAEIHVGN